MATPTHLFLDYEDVRAHLSDDALVGSVRYQSRPLPVACQHKKVRYGSEAHGRVGIVCKCGMLWDAVPVVAVMWKDLIA